MNRFTYRTKVTLLALGAVAGFALGFHHLRHHKRHCRAELEERVTKICAESLRRAQQGSNATQD